MARRFRPEARASAIPEEEPKPLGIEIDLPSAELWDEYTSTGHRTLDNLYNLWKDPKVTNPAIRQRIVAIMTSPSGYPLPYNAPDQSLPRLLAIDEEVNGQKTSSLRDRFQDSPELAQELAAGLKFWADRASANPEEEYISQSFNSVITLGESISRYQAAIRDLIPLLDEPAADSLFESLQINDFVADPNAEAGYGYVPLDRILTDIQMPQKYKEVTLAKWFQLAETEAASTGGFSGREESTAAMMRLVDSESYRNAEIERRFGMDDYVYNTMVGFLEKAMPPGSRYISGRRVRRAAARLEDPDLRFDLAFRHLSIDNPEDWQRYQMEGPHDPIFMMWFYETAQAKGIDVTAIVDRLAAEYDQKVKEREEQEAIETKIQSRLRQ